MTRLTTKIHIFSAFDSFILSSRIIADGGGPFQCIVILLPASLFAKATPASTATAEIEDVVVPLSVSAVVGD